jgi:hypothetical protein
MTTTRFEWLARRLVLVLGLGVWGCGDPLGAPVTPAGETPAEETPAAPTRAALEAEAQDDLARLRALQLVEVRGLRLPDQKTHCYGNPCPDGATWERVLDGAYARIVPRLTRVTELAESTANDASVAPADTRSATDDIASLDAMGIVELGALLTVAPADNPNCYNLPCPEDEAKAAATNARKAGVLRAWRAEIVARKL